MTTEQLSARAAELWDSMACGQLPDWRDFTLEKNHLKLLIGDYEIHIDILPFSTHESVAAEIWAAYEAEKEREIAERDRAYREVAAYNLESHGYHFNLHFL